MPTSITISLSLTLAYLLLSVSKEAYGWYISKAKIDFLLAFMFGSWIFSFCSAYAGAALSLVLSVVFVTVILLCHFSIYYTSLHGDGSRVDEEDVMKIVGTRGKTEAPPAYENPYNGKTGKIGSRLDKTHYLGTIDTGDGKDTPIIVACSESMSVGDNFVITGVNGSDIMAEKE